MPRPWELQTRMSLQKFQKFEGWTGSSIRVQPAVGQASFGEPSLMKCADVFSMLLAFQATPSGGSPSRSRLQAFSQRSNPSLTAKGKED